MKEHARFREAVASAFIALVFISAVFLVVSSDELHSPSAIIKEEADDFIADLLDPEKSVSHVDDATDDDDQGDVLKNLRSLKAYCMAAHKEATQKNEEGMTDDLTALLTLIENYGVLSQNENILISYGEVLGGLHRSFSGDMGKYLLKYLTKAMEDEGIVQRKRFLSISHGGMATRMFLDDTALGFQETPQYWHKLSVSIAAYEAALSKVEATSANVDAEAAMLCNNRDGYDSLLSRVQAFYSSTQLSGRAKRVLSRLQREGRANRKSWQSGSDTICTSATAMLQTLVQEEKAAEGCPLLAGTYDLGKIHVHGVYVTISEGIRAGRPRAPLHGIAKDCKGWVVAGTHIKTFSFDPQQQRFEWDEASLPWTKKPKKQKKQAALVLAEGFCPLDCATWYDGCNTCECEQGKATQCSKQSCQQSGKSACLSKRPSVSSSLVRATRLSLPPPPPAPTRSVWSTSGCVQEGISFLQAQAQTRGKSSPAKAICLRAKEGAATELKVVVRCCSLDGNACHSKDAERNKCFGRARSFSEATTMCNRHGYRLCTQKELRSIKCCGTGCGYDDELAWSSSTCGTQDHSPGTGEDDNDGDDSTDAFAADNTQLLQLQEYATDKLYRPVSRMPSTDELKLRASALLAAVEGTPEDNEASTAAISKARKALTQTTAQLVHVKDALHAMTPAAGSQRTVAGSEGTTHFTVPHARQSSLEVQVHSPEVHSPETHSPEVRLPKVHSHGSSHLEQQLAAEALRQRLLAKRLSAQLAKEHQLLLREREKTRRVKQEAARAVATVKAHALKEAKVVVEKMKRHAVKLAKSIAEKEASRLTGSTASNQVASKVATRDKSMTNQLSEIAVDAMHPSQPSAETGSGTVVSMAQVALKRAAAAQKAQAALQHKLSRVLKRQKSVVQAQEEQQLKTSQLVKHWAKSRKALAADLKLKVKKAIEPVQRRSVAALAMQKEEQQATVKNMQVLQTQLQLEHARRVDAENLGRPVVGQVQEQEMQEQESLAMHQLHKKNTLSGGTRLQVAKAAVKAAKAAMLQAGKMAHHARTAAARAKTG
jgi:hypothetical protein